MSKPHFSISMPGADGQQEPSTYQLQAIVYLSMMWIIIFGFALAAWTLFGGMLATQIAVVIGLIVTSAVFLSSDIRSHHALQQELARKATK